MRRTVAFLTDHFNDADGVVNLLNKHMGRAPSREAVVKWFERASIPGMWAFEVMHALVAETGEYPDMALYLETTDADIFD